MKSRTMWIFTGQLVVWCLGMMVFASISDAATMSFSWLPNSEPDLAGYKIYYGTVSREYATIVDLGLPEIVNGRVVYTITDAPETTTYFAATAYDTAGLESDYSAEVSTNPAPAPPADPLVISIVTTTTVTVGQ